jgi:hypothetical protein
LDLVRDENFKIGALQGAGQKFDKPEKMPHNMALDSEGKRRLREEEKLSGAQR